MYFLIWIYKTLSDTLYLPQIWNKYLKLKSDLRNKWCPHWKEMSADNEDTKLERVLIQVWIQRKKEANEKKAEAQAAEKRLEKAQQEEASLVDTVRGQQAKLNQLRDELTNLR